MSFRPQRDQPLPEGLVHGLTSIMFESALVPAEPPEPPQPSAKPHQPAHQDDKEKKDDERQTN